MSFTAEAQRSLKGLKAFCLFRFNRNKQKTYLLRVLRVSAVKLLFWTSVDNHTKGASKHTARGFVVCLRKQSNPTQEVPYEQMIRRFGSSRQ